MTDSRTKLHRTPHKACLDKEMLYAFLDSYPLATISFIDHDQPYGIPKFFWREHDAIYWHGAIRGRSTLESINTPICVTVMRLDGLVLARSAFNHSANFVSAMILGVPELIEDPEEKAKHLATFVDRFYPNRFDTLDPMTAVEVKATSVMRLSLQEASLKISEKDTDSPQQNASSELWTGVIPLKLTAQTPIGNQATQTMTSEALLSPRLFSK